MLKKYPLYFPGADDTWLPRFATMKNQPTKRPFANDNPNYPQKVSDQAETNFAILNYETMLDKLNYLL